MAERLVGSRVRRVEDPRLLSGTGRYVDDVALPGMLHAAFVRSEIPHGRILSINPSAALELDGVELILTGADLDGDIGPLHPTPVEGLYAPPITVLATDVVRSVGEPVAIVVASSRAVAEDAADLVVVEYEDRAAVVDVDAAMAPDAPLLYPEHGSNVVYRSKHRHGDASAALRRATHVVSERFRQQRVASVPMECRGCVADWQLDGDLEVYVTHQGPHGLRSALAEALGHPIQRVRVRCGDIGGSFGQKTVPAREDVTVCAASRRLRRPVKWIEDRRENLMFAGQAHEDSLDVSAGLDAEGRLCGVSVRMVVNIGAQPKPGFPAIGYADIGRVVMPAGYRIDDIDYEIVGVVTNKAAYLPYRGPWQVETWVRERIIDLLAAESGRDPVDVRRLNLWQSDELPRRSATGVQLLDLTQTETMERAVELIGYLELRREQESARREGRLLGIGLANFIEPAPMMPSFAAAMVVPVPLMAPQEARIQLEIDGSVTLFTSQQPHGQGHETTLAQLAADRMGVPLSSVRVVHGDTSLTPYSAVGTAASRSATLAGGAVLGAAARLRERVLDAVSSWWEVDVADLNLENGQVHVVGTPARTVDLRDVAQLAHRDPARLDSNSLPGLVERYAQVGEEGTWAQATHCCVVEVDQETGHVAIVRYLVVEDCGQMINPAVVDGQVRGGVAQGIASVLFEHAAYSPDGQFVAATFVDYLVPTAADLPAIEVHHHESPPRGTVPFRGAGEGGAIGAPAALTNAIADALSPLGSRITERYLPPSRILELAGQT